MKVRAEIEKYAAAGDKPALRYLLARYPMESQWHFVARCVFQRYGTQSYQVNRVWAPTAEGRALYSLASLTS